MIEPIARQLTAVTTVMALSILCTSLAFGTEIFHCVDANGKPVFSQEPCGKDARLVELEPLPTATVGEKSAMEQLEDMRAIRGTDGKRRTPQKKASSGDKTDCPFLSSLAKRSKMMSGELFKCMTKDELQRTVGREPNSVRNDSDGSSIWYYRLGGNRLTAYFDADGLLSRWTSRN